MHWKNKFPKNNIYYETDNGILYCEDCLKIMKKIPNESIDLIVTDPPYGISKKGKKISRKYSSSKTNKKDADIKLCFGDWDIFDNDKDFFNFTELWFKEIVNILKNETWMYIFFDNQKIGFFDLVLTKKYGVKSRTIFAWLKSNPVPSFRKVNWVSASELIWVGSKGECKIKNFLEQNEMFNYFITANKSVYGETEHPTEKPLSLIKKFIETSSFENDIVLDPFMGSGTTAIACEKLNRKWIGIEINPEYCEIAKKRLKTLIKNKIRNDIL